MNNDNEETITQPVPRTRLDKFLDTVDRLSAEEDDFDDFRESDEGGIDDIRDDRDDGDD